MEAAQIRVPPVLFHVTERRFAATILTEGLRSPFGNFMSASVEHAASFIRLRGHRDLVSVLVLSGGLAVEKFTDHSVAFFGHDDSWVVWDTVPPESLAGAFVLAPTEV